MAKIFIRGFGCVANQADSEAIAGLLKEKGYDLVNNENEADFIVVNTCG